MKEIARKFGSQGGKEHDTRATIGTGQEGIERCGSEAHGRAHCQAARQQANESGEGNVGPYFVRGVARRNHGLT